LADLTVTLDPAVAAACRDATDRYARMWKADGDDRPIGQLRTLVAADLLLRAWDTSRPPVTAHITIHAPLPSLLPPRAAPPSAEAPTASPAGPDAAARADEPERAGMVSGQPITAAHLRQLLRQWSDAGLDDLHAPDGGSLDVALTEPGTGRLRAVVTETALRRAAAQVCPQHAACDCPVLDAPPATQAYRPTAAQRRFIAARDRGCRHPGCSRPAIWTDADHVVAHDDGGETDCANLCTLCRRHHRLKTHAPGWMFAMTADGVLSVTTPSGVTRTTRPPGMGHGIDHLLLAPAGLLTRDGPDPQQGALPDGDPPVCRGQVLRDDRGGGSRDQDHDDDDGPAPF
jgi:hypothetical protein